MADKTIELEIALRDSVSQVLKEVAANLQTLNDKLTRGGTEVKESGDSIQKVAKQTRLLGENAKTTGRDLLGLSDSIFRIGAFLGPILGPSAMLVGGATMLGNKLKEFTNERLRLRALSENTGFTEDDISIMQRTQKRMGIGREEANANIERVGSKLQGLLTGRQASELFQGLLDMGLSRFGRELIKTVESGDIGKAFKMIVSEYESIRTKFGEAAATHYAGVVGLDESFLQRYNKASQGVVPAFRMSIEAAELWGERMGIVHQNLHNLWNWTIGNMIWAIVRTERGIGKAAKTAGEMPIVIPGAEGAQPAPYSAKPSKDVTAGETAKDMNETKKDSNKLFNDIRGILQRMIEKDRNLVTRKEGGPVVSGQRYMVGEEGPELFRSGGRYSLVGEGGPEFFRPKTTGTITKASVTADVQRAYATGEAVAREYKPPVPFEHPGTDLLMWVAGRWRFAARALNVLGEMPEARTALRKMIPESWFGKIEDDPNEPAPWKPGGEFDRLRAELDAERKLARELPKLAGEVDFKNVPPGVKTEADAEGFDDFTMSRSQAFTGAF